MPVTAVYALAGWPLVGSLSPGIHAAAFAAAGIQARYVARPTTDAQLAALVDEVRSGELAGANVTIPHKIAVRQWLDDESDLVSAIGAVNTLVRTDAGVRGENTDLAGFERALVAAGAQDGHDRTAVVLGAGGAARAATLALARCGYQVSVLARRLEQAEALIGAVDAAIDVGLAAHDSHRPRSAHWTAAGLSAATLSTDLLVNCTPIGAIDPIGEEWPTQLELPSRLTVLDIVAWPPETALVRRARAAGATALGGMEMLLGQAAESWRLWTGAQPPLDAMRRAAFAEVRGT